MALVTTIDSYQARIAAEKKKEELFKRQQEVEEYLIRTGDLANVDLDDKYVYESGEKKKNKGFFLDDTLKRNLDNFLIPAVDAKWDSVLIMSGLEGCQKAGSKVLMAEGEWKNIEAVKKGDLVLSPQEDGSYKYGKVTWTTKWWSAKNYNVKELNRNKKVLYNCSSNHLIPINKRWTYRDAKKNHYTIERISSEGYSKLGTATKKNLTTLSAMPIPNFLNREDCKIEPYTLGAFLGDGHFTKRHLGFTNPLKDKAIIDEINKYYQYISSYHDKKTVDTLSYRFSTSSDLFKLLQAYGLEDRRSGDKFIPKEALLSSLDYRKKVLSGLIDTDGYYSIKRSGYSICTKSPQLAQDILDLVYSIGGRASIRKVQKSIKKLNFTGTYYDVSFYLGEYDLYCKLDRKIKKGKTFYISSNRASIDVEETEPGMVYGFEIDTPSHLYITDNWMVTNNSGKSVFSSAICKYLDPTFPGPLIDEAKHARRRCDRVVFSPQDFYDAVDTAKPKQAIQFDEAILGLMAGDAGMSIQKMLMKKITLIRKKQLYILLVIPSIFSLRMSLAVQRSRYMIHTFSPDGITRGRFKFYNYPRKRSLYIKGKRDYNQDAIECNFMGNFVNTYGLFYDEKEYDTKKEYAIRTMMDSTDKKAGPMGNKLYVKASAHRNLLLLYLRTLIEGSQEGKEKLQKLIEYHSIYANAKKSTEMLNGPKFNKILKELFGNHLKLSNRILLDYLKKGETYLASKDGLLENVEEELPKEVSKEDTPKNDIPIDDTPVDDTPVDDTPTEEDMDKELKDEADNNKVI